MQEKMKDKDKDKLKEMPQHVQDTYSKQPAGFNVVVESGQHRKM